MDNPTNQPPKTTSRVTMWIVLIVVVIALGIGAYFLFNQGSDNTNNANTAITNTTSNKNVNSIGNTNVVNNSNTNSIANANVDTSRWKTYENGDYKITAKYPSDWKAVENTVTNQVFFNRGTVGGGLDAAALGIGFSFYTRTETLTNGKTLEEWVKASSSNYHLTQFVGLNGYETLWPSSIMTYRFILNRGTGVVIIDINYNETRTVEPDTGRPEFTPQELAFFNLLNLAK